MGETIGYLAYIYRADSIIKTTTVTSPSYTYLRRYVLANDKISRSDIGDIYNGDTTFYTQNSTTYIYEDNNLIYAIQPFITATVRPIDTLFYNLHFYNPFLMLGNHLWTLTNGNEFSDDLINLIRGESKNICSTENYPEYEISDATVTHLGTYKNQTTVLESADENNLLPKIIKRVSDGGLEQTMRFTYIKEK